MSLLERIDADLTEALKQKEETKKTVLRMLKSSLKNAVIEKNQAKLTDEEEFQVIAREIKRRKESIEAYTTANKPDLAKTEQEELEILSAYMPAQMSEDEIRQKVTDILSSGSFTLATMGQAMGKVSAELKGKADMSVVSRIVREQLQKSS